jgi:hypothetical protein
VRFVPLRAGRNRRLCVMTAPPGTTVLHHVPYYAQWESADLVPAIIGGEIGAADDPLWRRSGAQSAREYAFWSWRLCGVACLRMALGHWRGTAPTALALAAGCVTAGAYVRHEDRVDGLIHAPFAAYVEQRWGLRAEPRPELTPGQITGEVTGGALVMLSVHASIRELGAAPPRRGGHLVLAVGVTDEAVVIHNPSGFPGVSQRFAHVPWAELDRFHAGRGIVLAERPAA